MIWTIIPAVVLALAGAAGLARASARPAPAPQPESTGRKVRLAPAGDIGVAALACRPGWELACILDATIAGGSLIIRTVAPSGRKTGLVLPANNLRVLSAAASLLAVDAPPVAGSLAATITATRAGTVIAIRQETTS